MLYSRADESTLKRCRYIRFHKHPLVVILCSGSHHLEIMYFVDDGVRATQQRGGCRGLYLPTCDDALA